MISGIWRGGGSDGDERNVRQDPTGPAVYIPHDISLSIVRCPKWNRSLRRNRGPAVCQRRQEENSGIEQWNCLIGFRNRCRVPHDNADDPSARSGTALHAFVPCLAWMHCVQLCFSDR